MQTNTTAKIPASRIKKRNVLGALLMAGLSGSAVIAPYKVSNYITMDDFCVEPFSGKDRIIQTTIRIKKDYQYNMNFGVVSLDENLKERNYYGFEKDFPLLYGRTYYKAGTVLPYTFNIRKDLFVQGDTTDFEMLLKFEEFEKPSADAFELFTDSVFAGSLKPTTITSKMLPFRRDRDITYASYFYGNGFYSTRRYYTFDGKGFTDEYVSNHYGVIPLSDMQFTPTYYSPLSEKLSMSSGELQILNYVDDFDIGEVKLDKIKFKEYRSIPLELVYKNGYSYLRSKDSYFISKDLRTETSKNHKGEDGWYETKNLFLPPVKGFEKKTYSFKIIMNDTGECNVDTFIHNFKVIRTANAYGAKYNSDFFVREILDV